MSYLITIFTPTYNRVNLLPRLFESLKNQTSSDFEWIIVDDGSTDSTASYIINIQKRQRKFPIRFFEQANGGKHRAINRGVKEAFGEFFLILDSDDFLTDNSIELISRYIKKSFTLPHLGGVVGRKMYPNGEIIGGENYLNEIICDSLAIRYQYHIKGDLGEIFKTAILKEFPFPEFPKEKFCPEALVWNRIAQKYKLLFFNQGFYIADYQRDGLTASIVKLRMESPKASKIYYAELASYNIPFKEKIKAGINFWRFSFNDTKITFKKHFKQLPQKWLLLLYPVGYLMYLYDKRGQR